MSSSPAGIAQTDRITTVDALRGIASLAVCWFHFTSASGGNVLPKGLLRSSGTYGHLGVDIFFVISGFVIPYALARSGYRLVDFPKFVARRTLRLEPAYFCAVALTVVLLFLSSIAPSYRGPAFHVSTAQVAAHLTYTTEILGYPWLDSVFWTLAIEFQFYLLIGLLFPLMCRPRWTAVVWLTLAVSAFVLPMRGFATHYMFLFLIGIVTFRHRSGALRTAWFAALLIAAFCGAALTLSLPQAIAGIATALAITYVDLRSRVLLYFGAISYSIYLVHAQIGGRVLNLSTRLAIPGTAKGLVVLAALAASVACADVFYRLLERPGQRLASRIRYGGGSIAVPAPVPSLRPLV